jgi:hypothetical protein
MREIFRLKEILVGVLDFCTLTGADDGVDPSDLLHLSAKHPFVEWGVLFHNARQGQGRYPSFAWIEVLCALIPSLPKAQFALHICGRDAVHEFLQGTGKVSAMAVQFGRIQLNLTASNVNPALLIAAIRRHPSKTIVTQHNAANESLWRLLSQVRNHAVLFDASGGRGISPTSWPSPLPRKLCGYAGGLGPANLATELPRIQLAAGKNPFWIDMEGKLRSESDYFDLSSAQTCLSIVHEVFRHDS